MKVLLLTQPSEYSMDQAKSGLFPTEVGEHTLIVSVSLKEEAKGTYRVLQSGWAFQCGD
jgi:hypothetical protein